MARTSSIGRVPGGALGLAVATPFAVAAIVLASPLGVIFAIAGLVSATIAGATYARRLVAGPSTPGIVMSMLLATFVGAVVAAAFMVIGTSGSASDALSEFILLTGVGLMLFGMPALVLFAAPATAIWLVLARRLSGHVP